ncbi:hypothetical protein HMPREF6745_0684 [Prevotella sp. oral taxon 472 str. F0295]|nr:hypothetical protein HMPREF6745_0684 [Prevotella sp. oral taxon 472 str. F0295]
MTALNKNGIIRVIPLKGHTMKAAVLKKHNKNRHALLQQSILLPSPLGERLEARPVFEIEA